MNFKKGKALISILALTLLTLLAACGSDNNTGNAESTDDTESKSIHMGQIDWAENIAVTNMWKVILEEKGYDVEFSVIDMGTTMKALESGELDASLEIWLPVQDANYLEEYQDKVNFSEETWYDTAQVGLVVPSYMEDINSVEDLNANKEKFESEIIGFEPGAGTMIVAEQLIKDYNLELELVPSSTAAMIGAIHTAMDDNEPIVAPLWKPHRIFSELDLKFLDDPKGTFGGVEKIHHATRHGFEEDFPKVDKWLKNWKMDDKEIGTLMSYVKEAEDADKDPIEGARKWVEENQDVIDEWVK